MLAVSRLVPSYTELGVPAYPKVPKENPFETLKYLNRALTNDNQCGIAAGLRSLQEFSPRLKYSYADQVLPFLLNCVDSNPDGLKRWFPLVLREMVTTIGSYGPHSEVTARPSVIMPGEFQEGVKITRESVLSAIDTIRKLNAVTVPDVPGAISSLVCSADVSSEWRYRALNYLDETMPECPKAHRPMFRREVNKIGRFELSAASSEGLVSVNGRSMRPYGWTCILKSEIHEVISLLFNEARLHMPAPHFYFKLNAKDLRARKSIKIVEGGVSEERLTNVDAVPLPITLRLPTEIASSPTGKGAVVFLDSTGYRDLYGNQSYERALFHTSIGHTPDLPHTSPAKK